MRTVAIIENSKVVNIVSVLDGQTGDKEIQELGGIDVTGIHVSAGWSYLNGEFYPPEPTTEELAQIELEKQKQASFESAKVKLAALGLSEEEIAALIGK